MAIASSWEHFSDASELLHERAHSVAEELRFQRIEEVRHARVTLGLDTKTKEANLRRYQNDAYVSGTLLFPREA